MDILISGTSIAGPAAAFWLARQGHSVTVVERAPALRRGGYAIDVRGVAVEVVERMGLRERLRPLETDTEENAIVDREGRCFGRLPRGFGVIDPEDFELLRGDLAGALHEVTRDLACYRFGDTITSLHHHERGVDVTFASGERARYDLVVGADGVHSTTRALAFGPESRFVRDLGSAMAIFTAPNLLGLVRSQLSFNDVRRIAIVKSDKGDRDLKVCLFFPMARADFDSQDVPRQRAQVAAAFAGAGWELPRLIEAMWSADDFYCDLTCQIRMDCFHRDRVVLVGDAAHCPSPLTGQGTSLALVGSFMLAHEIEAARGDLGAALPRYDAAIRDFVTRNQDLAMKMAGGFTAKSRFELGVRNAVLRALPHLPGTSFLMSLAMRSIRDAARAITLPPKTSARPASPDQAGTFGVIRTEAAERTASP